MQDIYKLANIDTKVSVGNAIKNTSIAHLDNEEDNDPDLKLLETKAKAFDIISNTSFWCGLVLMIAASSQLQDTPQFSYILFAISGTTTVIWLITVLVQLFYVFKFGKRIR